ncbi:hypothetical protein [Pseudalkalibacillus sp. SCS-8]|uniref:hypothetical protein n=1 Tax=Pseudalkalibacillus nanhaiensis TaxID=3115291 RepID=UPI0032DBE47E
MKNLRLFLHLGLLVSFVLPWLKIPLFFTTVTITGFLVPYKTRNLANELNDLGIITISNDQMLQVYLMLLAPILSMLVVISLLRKRPLEWYFDSLAGVIAVMSCLYVMTNSGNIISFGLYITLLVSMLLVASPLLDKNQKKAVVGMAEK